MLLSITLETYNQENYIKQTLDSILNQCQNIDFELLIGDDCSTDNTPKILDEYANKFSQIRVIHNPTNYGAMHNFYNIVSKISGKYWMDCAGDDVWIDGKVDTQIKFLESNSEYGMCCGYAKEMIDNRITSTRLGRNKVSLDELIIENNIIASTCCVKTSLLQQYLHNISPQEKNWLMEDYPMWIWFSKNSKIKFIESDFAYYRMLPDSVSHSSNLNKEKKFLESVYEIRDFFSDRYTLPKKENDLYFDLFYSHYRKFLETKQYEFIKNMKSFYTNIKHKSYKIKFIRFFCSFPFVLLWIEKISK